MKNVGFREDLLGKRRRVVVRRGKGFTSIELLVWSSVSNKSANRKVRSMHLNLQLSSRGIRKGDE
jgi:hypothetical protein